MTIEEEIKTCEHCLNIAKDHDDRVTLYQYIAWFKELKKLKEEKHYGKWIEVMSPVGSMFECSECGEDVRESDTFIFSFCPFCGAYMVGSEDGEEE